MVSCRDLFCFAYFYFWGQHVERWFSPVAKCHGDDLTKIFSKSFIFSSLKMLTLFCMWRTLNKAI